MKNASGQDDLWDRGSISVTWCTVYALLSMCVYFLLPDTNLCVAHPSVMFLRCVCKIKIFSGANHSALRARRYFPCYFLSLLCIIWLTGPNSPELALQIKIYLGDPVLAQKADSCSARKYWGEITFQWLRTSLVSSPEENQLFYLMKNIFLWLQWWGISDVVLNKWVEGIDEDNSDPFCRY